MKRRIRQVIENLRSDEIKSLFVGCMTFVMLIVASGLLKNDFGEFLKWWLILIVLGVSCMPLAAGMFESFGSKGWLFAKTIGIALCGWTIWMLSSIKLIKFNTLGCYIAVFIVAAINYVFLWLAKKKKFGKGTEYSDAYLKVSLSKENIKYILITEFVFLTMFIFWTYLKGFAPDAHGTEKQMDYGFMQAIMKSEYMPPEDLWLSGHALNYYYVGQFFAVFITKLSGLGCEYGYNLMLMTIAGIAFAMPASLIFNIARDFSVKRKPERSKFARDSFAYLSGGLAGTAVLFAGNMHYVIKGVLAPAFRSLLGVTKMASDLGYTFKNYWFPDATRYIGYDPETADKTIHEFPLYSVVLGDLHAHVINIIFVITVLGILYCYLKNREKKYRWFCPEILLAGFFIGLFHTTNYWDFPIYFVVSGAIILFTNLIIYEFKFRAWLITAIQAVVIIVISVLVSLPFTLSFVQISSEIEKCADHSPLYQLLVLWGLPLICLIVYSVSLISESIARSREGNTGFVMKASSRRPIARFLQNIDGSDLFILTIMLCAAGLIMIPEVIYVKDIYTGEFKRANTMFKLTYQSFIMFGMGMSFILMRSLFFETKRGIRKAAIILLCLLLWTTGYFGVSTKAWFGDWKNTESYRGIKCDEFMKKIDIEDYDAINWINENIEGRPVMLEANGDSYSDYCRVSVLTGLPTLLGWRTHEWLWQSDGSGEYPEIMSERERMIEQVYTTEDISILSRIIRENSIEYIYVGNMEKVKYTGGVNHELLLNIGDVVYPTDYIPGDEFDRTYIIKVDNDLLK